MSPAAQFLAQSLGHADAATHHHHIDILRWAFQVEVAHIAAHHIALECQFIGRLAYEVKEFGVEESSQLLRRYISHCVSFLFINNVSLFRQQIVIISVNVAKLLKKIVFIPLLLHLFDFFYLTLHLQRESYNIYTS